LFQLQPSSHRLHLLTLLLVGMAGLAAAQPTGLATTAAPPDLLANLKFRNLGPAVGGGRVSAVVGIPGVPNVYYVGAAGGGVFKTLDGGLSWKPVFEKEASASIGAIALAPSNPNLVWVGTGEGNPRNDVITGHGIYFSPDAGANWKFMGLGDVGQITQIVIDPSNPERVFVAALGHVWGPNPERGIFRTTDGGATWQKVLYVDENTGASDLAMEPGNPLVLFAGLWHFERHAWTLLSGGGGSGVYRSTDGGTTWKKLTEGLPDGTAKDLMGRVGLALAPSEPTRVYALIENKKGTLWRSDDLGDHWKMVSNNHLLDVRPFYFSHLAVAPNNPDKLYFLSFVIATSSDGGKTATAASAGVHPDHHTIWIDPKDANRIIEGNDGGVYISADGGTHFRYLDNLPIEQFYMVAADGETPYNLCGGLQDNNGWCGPSNSLSRGGITATDWFVAVGGDGEYVVPAPADGHVIYADSQDGSIERLDTRTGLAHYQRPYLAGTEEESPANLKYRFNWTSPIAVGAHSANDVYLGGNVLFHSTDGGARWDVISPDLTRNDKSKQQSSGGPINLDISGAETYDTILSLALAPTDPKVIWVGTDDGLVQVTRDGGAHWANVAGNIAGLPEWGRVQQIEVSPFDPATCYVAFDLHEQDNNHPYAYKTHDFGRTWTSIAGGLPDGNPARVVREDPNHKGFLVLGTDAALFYSRDEGAHWLPLKSNFPTAAVYDLQFVKPSHDLVVATHGRGLFVLDNITPLEEADAASEGSDFHLFSAHNGTMFHTWNKHGFSQSSFVAPNPDTAVGIDYFLKTELKPTPEQTKEHETPVKIVVTDAQGGAVRTFYGPAKAGFNRASWDMHYDGPHPLSFAPKGASDDEDSPDHNLGPPVVPGTYKVAVTVNGKTETTHAVVGPDPRLPVDLAAFTAETRAGLAVRAQISALNDGLNRLESLHQQLATIEKLLTPIPNEAPNPNYAPVLTQAEALDKQLLALKGEIYNTDQQQAVAEDDIHYLQHFADKLTIAMYEAAYAYDQAPTPLIEEDLALRSKELTGYLERINALLSNQVAVFNKLALEHGSSTLFAGAPVAVQETAAGGGR